MKFLFVPLAALTATVATTAAFAAHEMDGRNIASGEVLYGENCASCHGAQLQGQPDWRTPDGDGILPAPPHNETGHTWHHGNAQMFTYTRLGGQLALEASGMTGFTSGMPGFSETLSDAQIWDILAFIRSTWSPRIQDLNAGRNPPHS